MRDGSYVGSTRGHDLAEVGFVHASTAAQLPRVVAGVYPDDPLDDHVVLVIDAAACDAAGAPVRWEVPGDSGELFPHIYGAVPGAAVIAVLPISRDPDGRAAIPDLTRFDVVEDPPAY